jgi:hypothetical protein
MAKPKRLVKSGDFPEVLGWRDDDVDSAALLADRLFLRTGYLHGLTKTCRPLVQFVTALEAGRIADGAGTSEVPVTNERLLAQILPDVGATGRRAAVGAAAICARGHADATAQGPEQPLAIRIAAVASLAAACARPGLSPRALAVTDDGEAL